MLALNSPSQHNGVPVVLGAVQKLTNIGTLAGQITVSGPDLAINSMGEDCCTAWDPTDLSIFSVQLMSI